MLYDEILRIFVRSFLQYLVFIIMKEEIHSYTTADKALLDLGILVDPSQ